MTNGCLPPLRCQLVRSRTVLDGLRMAPGSLNLPRLPILVYSVFPNSVLGTLTRVCVCVLFKTRNLHATLIKHTKVLLYVNIQQKSLPKHKPAAYHENPLLQMDPSCQWNTQPSPSPPWHLPHRSPQRVHTLIRAAHAVLPKLQAAYLAYGTRRWLPAL